MGKCYIQNLGLIVTNKCNLNCAHCLRGEKNNSCISDRVVEATLDQIKGIWNLAICGGEPTLAIDRIEKIISYVIEKHIKLGELTVTINGTIYSERLLKLLDEINSYIGISSKGINALLAISFDKYHLDEISRLKIEEEFYENLRKYQESKYFYGYRNTKQKLFREGNAINLDEKLTVPLRPIKILMTYADKKRKFNPDNGLCSIGPVITINPEGIVTECDASIKNQENLYNYGNVLEKSIEDIVLEKGEVVSNIRKFERDTHRLLRKHSTYNK